MKKENSTSTAVSAFIRKDTEPLSSLAALELPDSEDDLLAQFDGLTGKVEDAPIDVPDRLDRLQDGVECDLLAQFDELTDRVEDTPIDVLDRLDRLQNEVEGDLLAQFDELTDRVEDDTLTSLAAKENKRLLVDDRLYVEHAPWFRFMPVAAIGVCVATVDPAWKKRSP